MADVQEPTYANLQRELCNQQEPEYGNLAYVGDTQVQPQPQSLVQKVRKSLGNPKRIILAITVSQIVITIFVIVSLAVDAQTRRKTESEVSQDRQEFGEFKETYKHEAQHQQEESDELENELMKLSLKIDMNQRNLSAEFAELDKIHNETSRRLTEKTESMLKTQKIIKKKLGALLLDASCKTKRDAGVDINPDWYRVNEKYSYKIFKSGITYANAKIACEKLCSNLAAVGLRDIRVRGQLSQWMEREIGTRKVWVGLDNWANMNVWEWADGVEGTSGNILWAAGHPTAYKRKWCGMLETDGNSIYSVWCDVTSYYLCETVL